MDSLPETYGDKAAAAPTSGQTNTNPPPSILVVEDDGDIRRFNVGVLIHSGYRAEAAEDGAIAWDTLQLNSYDLLITDHNMPKLTGVELLKKLRAARMALPVILASGTIPTEELNRQPPLQIEATLLKPYTAEELLGTVRKVLRATDGARVQIVPPCNATHQPRV